MTTIPGRVPNTVSDTEAWLIELGSKFIDVRLYLKVSGNLTWSDERHIDDLETLPTTVSMSLERQGGRFAVWPREGKWQLFDRQTGEHKRYPNQEAAEMVAIHRHG